MVVPQYSPSKLLKTLYGETDEHTTKVLELAALKQLVHLERATCRFYRDGRSDFVAQFDNTLVISGDVFAGQACNHLLCLLVSAFGHQVTWCLGQDEGQDDDHDDKYQLKTNWAPVFSVSATY
jgi:hypothetical protein